MNEKQSELVSVMTHEQRSKLQAHEFLAQSVPPNLTTCPYWLTQIFHESFGLVSNTTIVISPSVSDRERRLRLILEEFKELVEAMGFNLVADDCDGDTITVMDSLTVEHIEGSRYCPIETADALGDLNVVVNGTAVEFGIPLPIINQEIFLSNMSKLGNDRKPIINGVTASYREGEPGFRSDAPIGKALKGPNYVPPNLPLLLLMTLEKSNG